MTLEESMEGHRGICGEAARRGVLVSPAVTMLTFIPVRMASGNPIRNAPGHDGHNDLRTGLWTTRVLG